MRPISWVKAAKRDFMKFPVPVQQKMVAAITMAVKGDKADLAKPIKGLGAGVFEAAIKYATDAYRVVYAVQVGGNIWVVHAFKKKSKKGMATPKKEIDLIKERIKSIKE